MQSVVSVVSSSGEVLLLSPLAAAVKVVWFWFFSLIKYVIPEVLPPLLMGLALFSVRSILQLAGIDSVGDRGNLSQKTTLQSLFHPCPSKNLATQTSTTSLCLGSAWSLQLSDWSRFSRLPRVAAVLMPKHNQMLLFPSVLLPGALVQPQRSFK